MKKLEKLGSKLFEEFRGDEVSELASVIGGLSTPTKRTVGGCTEHDTYTWGGGTGGTSTSPGDLTAVLTDTVFHSMGPGFSEHVNSLPPHLLEEHFATVYADPSAEIIYNAQEA